MPRRQTAVPPALETLRAFFRDQRAQPLARAAALLGWSRAEVKRRAVEEDALLPRGLVSWSHVASWLFETWTYEWVVLTLGKDAELLPAGLRPVPVLWYAPAWIVHALNVQRQMESLPHRIVHSSTLSEYLTDFLARGIDPATVDRLRGDRDFLAGFHFPHDEPET